jgi:phosphoglycolate phosphatase-like HAD superfamily hydrolase
MRVAFDLDGVLAELHEPFVRAAVTLFPELDRAAIKSADIGASPDDPEDPDAASDAITEVPSPPSDVPLTPRQSDAVWRHLAAMEDFWEGLGEIESGAIRRLAAVADERRWEVLFITSRPRSAGRTVQRQSQRWLERCGFPLPSVYVVHGSRGRIAAALGIDVVVDDRPENCLDVVLESKAGALLVWRGAPDTVPGSARRLGIAVVPTVEACLDAIIKAQDGGAERGFLDRLRGLFGLRVQKHQA